MLMNVYNFQPFILFGTNTATLRSSYMLYQFRPSVRLSVRHTGGLRPHRSTDRNNLGVVGEPQHSSF